jgi:hypothetical protein
LPVIERIAQEYGDRIAFVAVAWKGTFEETAERAAELIPSGVIKWGLDEEEEVFSLFAVPYQPHTVLITNEKTIHNRWPGVKPEDEIRAELKELLVGP